MSANRHVAAFMTLLSFAGIAAAATAPPAPDVPSRAVKYDARSLGNDDAVRALYRRIIAASREVCPDVSGGHLWASEATAKCRKEAIARAVMQVNDPRLAALSVAILKKG